MKPRQISITYWIIGLLFVTNLLTSCDGNLRQSLDLAGDNRDEMEKVLRHFKNDQNPLKYKAAQFLIENMPYHYGWEHEDTTRLHAYYHALQGSNVPAEEIYDSISKADGVYDVSKKHQSRDIETIKAEFLIDHINAIFEMWETRPWKESVSFDTFCRHILPYRLRDEPLRPWAKELFNKFDCLLDSLRQTPDSADIKKAASIVLDHFKSQQLYFTHAVPQGVNVGVDNVYWKTGDCKEFADILTWVLRALGIPSGCDTMIVRGDNNVPHYWNYIIDNEGKSWYGSITYEEGFKSTDTYWNPKGKVWRESFALNEVLQNKLLNICDIEDIHPRFRYPLIEDVTSLYANPKLLTIEVNNEMLSRIPDKKEPIYMCLSVRDRWIPVGIADRKDTSVELAEIEGEVVFRLATAKAGKLNYISRPFWVDRETGDIRWFNSMQEDMVEVCLLHKFNLRTEPFGTNMIDGIFEGCDNINFNNADTLHIISIYPERRYNTVFIPPHKPYKYLRYKSPQGGFCDIAEITFYDEKGNQISGTPFGTINKDKYWSGFIADKVFDGDTDTSYHFEKADDGWVGLKLDKPSKVSKIVYTPRNRKNFIQQGDTYELFYCDGEWKSAGVKTADSDSLLFFVPKGSLLYLKNHTEGNQERIFEITQEGQHWM